MRPVLGPQYYSDIPLVTQVSTLIEQLRAKGETQLPSETQMCRSYGVDRLHLHRILQALCRDGILYAVKNRGFFILGEKLDVPVSRRNSYTRNMQALQAEPHSRVLGIDLVQARGELAEIFGGEKILVWAFDYLRYLRDMPISIARVHIRQDSSPKLNVHIKDNASLYEVLLKEYGIQTDRVRTYCEAVSSDVELASFLGVPQGSPLLKLTHLAHWNGSPFEYTLTFLRSDACRVRIDIE